MSNPDFPQPFTSAVPLPNSNSLTPQFYLVNSLALRDTNPHTYRTDGGTVKKPGAILLAVLGDQLPPVKAFAIWVVNTTDQAVTVTPLSNVDPTGLYPDNLFPVGSALVVASGDTDQGDFPWDSYACEFLSAQVQAMVAPTKGTVSVVLLVYH